VPLWARGLRRLLCDAQLRPAGIAAAAVLGAQFLLGGKPYYPGGPEPAEQIGWPGEVTLVLRATFASVREVAVYTNGLGIRNQEEDTPVYVATGLRTTWAAAWPAFRHYD
jgi:hypothetical protein